MTYAYRGLVNQVIGVTYNQAASITSPQAISQSRAMAISKSSAAIAVIASAKKSIGVAKGFVIGQSIVSVLRSIRLIRSLTTSQTIAIARKVGRLFVLAQASGLSVIRSVKVAELFTLSITARTTVQRGGPVSISTGQTLSLRRSTLKIVIPLIGQVIGIAAAISRGVIKVFIPQAVTAKSAISSGTISLTTSSNVSTSRTAGKGFVQTISQMLSVKTSVAKILSATISEVVTIVRATSKLISDLIAETFTVDTARNQIARTVTVGQVASVQGSISRLIIGTAISITASVVRTQFRAVGIVVIEVITLAANSLAKNVSTTIGETASIGHNIARVVSYSQAQNVVKRVLVNRLISFATSAQSFIVRRSAVRAFGLTIGQSVSIVRQGTKILTARIGQIVSILAARSLIRIIMTSEIVLAIPTAIWAYVRTTRWTASAASRRRVASIRENSQLARAIDIGPPITPNEDDDITFDYGPILAPGETIASIVSVTAVVVFGTDSMPANTLIGLPSLGQSPITGGAAAAVIQRVGNTQQDVTYSYHALALTSTGRKLENVVHLQSQGADTL